MPLASAWAHQVWDPGFAALRRSPFLSLSQVRVGANPRFWDCGNSCFLEKHFLHCQDLL